MTDNRSPKESAASSSSSETKYKCTFCDVTFKCDMDASRHLTSTTHTNNRDTFMSLQNLNSKDVEKQIPKNLAQVLQLLKLRTVKDLEDLSDKGYFRVQNESLAEVAARLAKVLFKSHIEFETRNFPAQARQIFLQPFENNPQPAPRVTSTTVSPPPTPQNRNTSPVVVKVEAPQPRLLNEPPLPRPVVVPTAGPLPPVQVSQSKAPPPVQVSQSRAPPPVQVSQSRAPQPAPVSQSKAPPPVQVSQSRAQPRQKQARVTTQGSSSTPSSSWTPTPPTQAQSYTPRPASKRVPAPTPVSSSSAAPRSSGAPSDHASKTVHKARPNVEPRARTQVAPKPVDPKATSGSNKQSSNDKQQPKRTGPRLDSTYIPKLAIINIKSEPKD